MAESGVGDDGERAPQVEGRRGRREEGDRKMGAMVGGDREGERRAMRRETEMKRERDGRESWGDGVWERRETLRAQGGGERVGGISADR